MRGKKMPKQEEQFAYLFGSANRKKLASRIQGKWSSLPTDCGSIDTSIKIVEEDIAAQIKKSSTEKGYNLKSTKIIIQQSQTALGELKKMREINCSAVIEDKKAMEEQKFQDKLEKISEDAIAKAKGDTQGSAVNKLVENVKSNKNIYLIGGGILVLGVVSYFLFKKK